MLLSATAARPGDIVRSYYYTDEYCMKWKDLDLTLGLGGTISDLSLTMILRFTKGLN